MAFDYEDDGDNDYNDEPHCHICGCSHSWTNPLSWDIDPWSGAKIWTCDDCDNEIFCD